MKSELIVEAVGGIDDAFIQRASQSQAKVLKFEWVKWVVVAACLGVAVMIAVPALSGKTPEVEPNPNEVVSAQPVVVSDPVNGQVTEPAASETQKPGWAGGGIFQDSRDYANYTEFAADVYDPVFEAFDATEEAKMHDWRYQVNSTPNTYTGADGELYEDGMLTQISCSWSNSAEVVLANDVESVTIYSYSDDPLLAQSFAVADEEGTSKNYQVDGIEIQKVGGEDTQRTTINGVWHFTEGGGDFSSRTIERVSIDGLWYYVDGTDEAEVDSIATALARIANQI